MSARAVRLTLLALLAVLACAALPALAQAAITPTLTLNQSAGTTAASTPAGLGFALSFTSTAGMGRRTRCSRSPAACWRTPTPTMAPA